MLTGGERGAPTGGERGPAAPARIRFCRPTGGRSESMLALMITLTHIRSSLDQRGRHRWRDHVRIRAGRLPDSPSIERAIRN